MKSFLCGASGLILSFLFSSAPHAAAVGGQGTWQTTLQARDFDGDAGTIEGWYDTVLGITWLADANYTQTIGESADGRIKWADALVLADNLQLYGIDAWRLPSVTDTGSIGCDFAFSGTDCGFNVDTSTSEMSYMYYVTLGNKAYYDTGGNPGQAGWGLTNTGPFVNLQNFSYWADKLYTPDTSAAWHFDFILGHQGGVGLTSPQNFWAVHDGDVGMATVPVPAAMWLFGSGLFGLSGMVMRKKSAVR